MCLNCEMETWIVEQESRVIIAEKLRLRPDEIPAPGMSLGMQFKAYVDGIQFTGTVVWDENATFEAVIP